MKTFAYLFNPLDIQQLKHLIPLAKLLPYQLLKSRLTQKLPLKIIPVTAAAGLKKHPSGHLIVCPLLSLDLLKMPETAIFDTITEAINIASQKGAKIVGLGGHFGEVANKHLLKIRKLKLPVTTGSALSAWSIFETAFRVAQFKKVSLSNETVLVINAAHAVNSLSAKKISYYVKKMYLCGDDPQSLQQLKDKLPPAVHAQIISYGEIDSVAQEIDLVVSADMPQPELFKKSNFKDSVILCTTPFNHEYIKNTTVFKKASALVSCLIKLPYPFPRLLFEKKHMDIVDASLAETLLLTEEERFVPYSLGEHINVDKTDEIADIAAKHHFEVWLPEAPFL